MNELITGYLKNESVICSCNWCQIQIGIPACVMSSEYFTRTSLYLVRLKIFEWIKLLQRQIQGNWGGRKSYNCLMCEFTAHYVCKNVEMNLKFTTTNGFNFWIINSLMESWEVCLTWLDCKYHSCWYNLHYHYPPHHYHHHCWVFKCEIRDFVFGTLRIQKILPVTSLFTGSLDFHPNNLYLKD